MFLRFRLRHTFMPWLRQKMLEKIAKNKTQLQITHGLIDKLLVNGWKKASLERKKIKEIYEEEKFISQFVIVY